MNHRYYNYQYRRPRLQNPTYQSSNVNHSLTFFNNSNHYNDNINRNPQIQRNHIMRQQSLPQKSINNNSEIQSSSIHQNNINNNQQASKQNYQYPERIRASSHLSNYGTNLLSFNQKQIFDKQNSKYNIISVKPKNYDDSIRQFPKLTLQDKDQYFYRKIKAQQNVHHNYQRINQNQILPNSFIAGKKTFAAEPNKIEVSNNYFPQKKKYFTPKMLNHADQVGNIL